MTSPYYFREADFNKEGYPSITLDVEDVFDIGSLTLSTQSRRDNPYIGQIMLAFTDNAYGFRENYWDDTELVGDLLPFNNTDHIRDILRAEVTIESVLNEVEGVSDKTLYQYINDHRDAIIDEIRYVAESIEQYWIVNKIVDITKETLLQLSATLELPCMMTNLDAVKTEEHTKVEYIQCQYGDTVLQSYMHDGSFVSLLQRIKEGGLTNTVRLAIEKANLPDQVDALTDEIKEVLESDLEKESLTDLSIDEVDDSDILKSSYLSSLITQLETDLPEHKAFFAEKRAAFIEQDDSSPVEHDIELQSDTELDDNIIKSYLGISNLATRPYYLEGIALKSSDTVFKQAVGQLEKSTHTSNIRELVIFYASLPLDHDPHSFSRYQSVMAAAKQAFDPEKCALLKQDAMGAALKVNNVSFFRKIARFEDPYKGIGDYLPFVINGADPQSVTEMIKTLTALKDKEQAQYQNDSQEDLFSRQDNGLYLGEETMASYHNAFMVLGASKEGAVAFQILDALNEGEQALFLKNLTEDHVEDYFISGAINYMNEIEGGHHESNPFFIKMMELIASEKPLMMRGLINNLQELKFDEISENIKNRTILKVAAKSKEGEHYERVNPFIDVDWAQHCEYIEKMIAQIKSRDITRGMSEKDGVGGELGEGREQFLL